MPCRSETAFRTPRHKVLGSQRRTTMRHAQRTTAPRYWPFHVHKEGEDMRRRTAQPLRRSEGCAGSSRSSDMIDMMAGKNTRPSHSFTLHIFGGWPRRCWCASSFTTWADYSSGLRHHPNRHAMLTRMIGEKTGQAGPRLAACRLPRPLWVASGLPSPPDDMASGPSGSRRSLEAQCW